MARSKIVAQGQITLTKIYDTALVKLTNEVVAIPFDSSGAVGGSAAYASAFTLVEVYMGTTKLDASSITLGTLTNVGCTASVSNRNKVSITAITSNVGHVEIPVTALIDNKSTNLGIYKFSFVKQQKGDQGNPGNPGTPGVSYTVNITGGVRGVAYAANGTTPEPSGVTSYGVDFYENSNKITSGVTYVWDCGGCLVKPSIVNQANFSPTISSSYQSTSTFVSVTITYGGKTFSQTIPVIATKHADGLDWINDWNNTSVMIGSNKIIAPRIFAGTKNASNQITGVALGKDIISGNANTLIGLVGYRNNLPIFSLDQNANFYVSSGGNAGSVQNGTANGLYFNGTDFFITGNMKIQSGSTIGSDGKLVEDVLTDVGNAQATATGASSVANTALSNINKITLEVDGNTKIKGDLIATGTITGESINAGSFAIKNSINKETFKIDADGNTFINGTLQSTLFNENQNIGYRVTPDGVAILNQARISGEFVMPNAGITNYGATLGNQNIALNTNMGVQGWQWSMQAGGKTIVELFEDSIKGVKLTRDSVAQTGWSVIQYTGINATKYKANTKYTVSFQVKTSVSASLSVQFLKGDGTSPLTTQSVSTPTITPNTWTDISVTLTTVATLPVASDQMLYMVPTNSSPGVSYSFRNLKIEEGTSSSPWCPNDTEQSDYVRMWAGSSYGRRDTAPFRVTQKGDLWATNATLSGRLLGDYDNGLIHMHNNQIVINDTNTFMSSLGEISEVSPMHFSSNAHIVLAPGQSMINTDLVFGTNSDRRIEYLNNSRKLTLNNTGFKSTSTSNNSSIDLNNNSIADHFDGIVLRGKTGGVHSIGYWNSASFLKFESRGNATHPTGASYDFVFEGSGSRNSGIEMFVDGNVSVSKSVKSNAQNIEMRSIANEGWGFYVT